jgi:Uma2 family endonuclease
MEVVVRSDDPAIVRVPDLVVTRVDSPETRLAVADVLLAVEVISPGSRNVDTRLKPFEYTDAGIRHYWLVDLDPPAPSITVFHLASRDFGYVESLIVGELVTSAPPSLRIDIAALVAPRHRIDGLVAFSISTRMVNVAGWATTTPQTATSSTSKPRPRR